MRVADHLRITGAVGLAVLPWARWGSLALLVGGVAIDVDHFIWYYASFRSLSPAGMFRFFYDWRADRQPVVRVRWRSRQFHGPVPVLLCAVLGLKYRWLAWLAAGLALHNGLDAYERRRYGRAGR